MTSQVHQLPLGPMENFIYIIEDEKSKKAAIIDPAWDVPYIISQVNAKGLDIIMVILTHGHHDHVNGLDELLTHTSVPVYISKHEHPILTPRVQTLLTVDDGGTIHCGDTTITCLHTPGHSPGCQCLRFDSHLITGDTLFIEGIGRSDLPGGDAKVLMKSLERIATWDDSLTVYPGHNYGRVTSDTLANVKRMNPYIQSQLNVV